MFIPSPIVFGHLFDGVCLNWKTSCGIRGACALYDIERMRFTILSFESGARIIVFIFYIIIFHVGKKEDAKCDKSKEIIEMNIT